MNGKIVIGAMLACVLLAGCGNASRDTIKQDCMARMVVYIDENRADDRCNCYTDYLAEHLSGEQLEAFALSVTVGNEDDPEALARAIREGRLKALDDRAYGIAFHADYECLRFHELIPAMPYEIK